MISDTIFIKPDWLEAPEIRRLFAALGSERALFVGGAVRDAFLKIPTSDFDLATDLRPEDVLERLEKAHIKAVATGFEHGTISAFIAGISFEITTLRRDIKSNGRHAEVVFGTDWQNDLPLDAARRDFTINALYLSQEGRLIDPLGGLEDLKERRVRFIGDARQRLLEDGLRLLRYFRFQAFYGRPDFTLADLDAVKDCLPILSHVSPERRQEELFKWLKAPDVSLLASVEAAEGCGLFKAMGFSVSLENLRRLMGSSERAGLCLSPLSKLALLGLEGDLPSFAKNLKMSKKDQAFLTQFSKAYRRWGETRRWGESESLLYHYLYGREIALIFLLWAGAELGGLAKPAPVFPLKGSDLQALGIKSGPEMGALLKRAESWWQKTGLAANKKRLLHYCHEEVFANDKKEFD